MIQITPDFVPDDHPIRGGPMVPQFIVIHNTGNTNPGADAAMHGRYIRTQDCIARKALWHFTVDDMEIRQHLPIDINGWHASDGYGPGNMTGIAIEICEHAGINQAAADRLAAQLCAHLIQTVPTLLPGLNCIRQHWDFARDRKNCPRVIRARPDGWRQFLLMVQAELAPAPVLITVDGVDLACTGRLEGATTRADLRPIVDALGASGTWQKEPTMAFHITRPSLTAPRASETCNQRGRLR